jgi:hypothetical protein
MSDHYRIDVAESKFGNQIAPSLNNFNTENYKVKNFICYKYIWYDRLDMANFCLSFS